MDAGRRFLSVSENSKVQENNMDMDLSNMLHKLQTFCQIKY